MTNLSGANLNNGAALGPQGEGMDSPSNNAGGLLNNGVAVGPQGEGMASAGHFSPYPAYKDSGVEWLGQVPEHWDTKQLRYLGGFRKGLTITKADLSDTGVPCLNYGEVHSKHPFEVNQDSDQLRFIPESYLDEMPSARIKFGDFVFADTSEDIVGVGNFSHVSGTGPLAAGYHTVIFSLAHSSASRYLAYCLDSDLFRAQLRTAVKGVKVFSITQEILKNASTWLPPTKEQTQIARFLDHETARIDALIAEQQRLIELLKEKRQAVISHAVTKGLNPNAPMKDSGVEWLGQVPKHWDVVPLKHVVDMPITDGPHETPEFIAEGVKFISAEAVSSGVIDFDKGRYISRADHERYSKKYSPKKFDIYMVKSGATTGVTAILESDTEFNIWSPLAVIRCGKGYSPYFVLHCMRSRNFQESVVLNWSFGTQQNIGMGVIENLPIAAPPYSEQLVIVEHIANESEKWDSLISDGVALVELLKERRSALISAAVTGKIDVRGWQPPVETRKPQQEQEAV